MAFPVLTALFFLFCFVFAFPLLSCQLSLLNQSATHCWVYQKLVKVSEITRIDDIKQFDILVVFFMKIYTSSHNKMVCEVKNILNVFCVRYCWNRLWYTYRAQEVKIKFPNKTSMRKLFRHFMFSCW